MMFDGPHVLFLSIPEEVIHFRQFSLIYKSLLAMHSSNHFNQLFLSPNHQNIDKNSIKSKFRNIVDNVGNG